MSSAGATFVGGTLEVDGLASLDAGLTVTGAKTTLAASTTGYAPLNIPTGTAPTSPADGDIWLDTTDNAVQSFTDGIKGSYNRTLGVMTSSKTVADNANFASLNSAANEGLVTIPANGWAVGRSYKITAWGVYGTTGTPTLDIRIRVGTNAADTGDYTMPDTVTNGMWRLDGVITCRVIGGSAEVFVQGMVVYQDTGVFADSVSLSNTSTHSFDSTGTIAIDLLVKWSDASASNTITLTNYILEELQLP